MSESKTYKGTCFCGAVQFTLSGEPTAMGYCHCESCRSWSAGPVNAFTLWKPDAMKITRGADKIGTYNRTTSSYRKWCTHCGGHLMNEHPGWGVIDIFAATIPGLKFKPALHVHYQETRMPMNDGLPKMKNMPEDMGGTGELMSE